MIQGYIPHCLGLIHSSIFDAHLGMDCRSSPNGLLELTSTSLSSNRFVQQALNGSLPNSCPCNRGRPRFLGDYFNRKQGIIFRGLNIRIAFLNRCLSFSILLVTYFFLSIPVLLETMGRSLWLASGLRMLAGASATIQSSIATNGAGLNCVRVPQALHPGLDWTLHLRYMCEAYSVLRYLNSPSSENVSCIPTPLSTRSAFSHFIPLTQRCRLTAFCCRKQQRMSHELWM